MRQVSWIIALTICLGASRAFGMGMLVERGRTGPLMLERQAVNVEIYDRVAETSVVQEFRNSSGRQLEADYKLSVPPGAALTYLALWVNGRKMEAEVVERGKARRVYTSIVNKRKDPALLEQIDARTYRVRIFPVPAGGMQKIEIRYLEVLRYVEGKVAYKFPLATDNPVTRQVRDFFTFVATVRTTVPVAKVTALSHDMDIHKKKDRTVLGMEITRAALGKDLEFHYQLKNDRVRVTTWTHRRKGEDGYFLSLITAPVQFGEQDALPHDITFVLDTSGSMRGEKMKQAKAALVYCLTHLPRHNRFSVVRFSTSAERFREGFIPADPGNITAAVDWVKKLRAAGGTNIGEAVQAAVKAEGRKGVRRPVILFTDGKPTVGMISSDQLVKEYRRLHATRKEVRLFSIGVGANVDGALMRNYAKAGGGAAVLLADGANVEFPIAEVFNKVMRDVMRDLEFSIPGANAYDVFPKTFHPLYAGQQMVVMGRFRKAGDAAVILRGQAAEGRQTLSQDHAFPADDQANGFISPMWARVKIAFLQANINKTGRETPELVKEIIALSTEHRVVTKYTSLLALETEQDYIARGIERHKRDDNGSVARPQANVVAKAPAKKKPVTRRSSVANARTDPPKAKVVTTPPKKEPRTARAFGGQLKTRSVEKKKPVTHKRHMARVVTAPPKKERPATRHREKAKSQVNIEAEADRPFYTPERMEVAEVETENEEQAEHPARGQQDAVATIPAEGTGTIGFFGVGSGGAAGAFGWRTGGGRKRSARKFGGSERSEKAVDAGLEWLQKHQEEGGTWNSGTEDVKATGLALLAFLGAGHTEKHGMYKQNVQRAVKWLIEHQDAKSGLWSKDNVQGNAIAAMALSEASGMARVPATVTAAQKAINGSVAAQEPYGGWGRAPYKDKESHVNDTLVTIWAGLALKSAKVSGLRVPGTAFEGTLKWLDHAQDLKNAKPGDYAFKGGRVGMRGKLNGPRPEVSSSLHTAGGALIRAFWGQDIRHPGIVGPCNLLLEENLPGRNRRADLGTTYFATLLMFQKGGNHWEQWNKAMQANMLAAQMKGNPRKLSGSWTPAAQGSRVQSTALSVLMLEVYYRYLPMYQN